MALGNLLGAIGSGLAKAATNYVTEKKKTTPTSTPTKTTSTGNEHADYINQTYQGGLDAYTKLQNDRYNQALQDSSNPANVELLKKLQADSQKVGYNLSAPQQTVQAVNPELENLLSAIETQQKQLQNMKYPDMGRYNFDDIQGQLDSLTNQTQNYKGANYMNMDEAIARANSQLGGMYNESMNNAIENYNKNAIARGMYGQMPVEALKQNAIAENELNKSNAINSLGANLYSQDFDMAQTENQNFYNQINQLSSLLGQQYNNELGQYQNDVNKYQNMYNISNDQLQNAFNLYNNLENVQNNKENKYANNIGQFSNDYMAEINKIKGDNDTSNDWQIDYLQNARNQKISGMNEAQTESQSETYKQAMDMFGKLGYASGWVAQALGLPEGTTTASYAKSLNSRGSSGGGSGGTTEPTLTKLTPAQMENYIKLATDTLSNEKGTYKDDGTGQKFIPYNPTTQEILQQTETYLKALGYDNTSINSYLSDINLQSEIEKEMQSRAIKNDYLNGNLPGLGGSIWDLVK